MYKSQDSNELKLMFIKTDDKVFVSDNLDGSSYFSTRLKGLYFDGKLAENTYKNDWFLVENIPSKIERKKPAKRVNERYELKEGFSETDLTPRLIETSYIDKDSNFYEVKGLYDFKYDLEDEGFEEIPFKVHVVENVEGDFEIAKNEFDLKYGLLDRIQTHPILLSTKPCTLTSEESYRIIRNFVKSNIDSKYAEITSDYDFCFTVQKKIDLYEPEQYKVDINALHKRRKPKYETRYNRSRKHIVYEAAPKTYNNYPIVKPFEGKNLDDLKNNVSAFLNELITMINEPLVECSCCKGRGVILDDDKA